MTLPIRPRPRDGDGVGSHLHPAPHRHGHGGGEGRGTARGIEGDRHPLWGVGAEGHGLVVSSHELHAHGGRGRFSPLHRATARIHGEGEVRSLQVTISIRELDLFIPCLVAGFGVEPVVTGSIRGGEGPGPGWGVVKAEAPFFSPAGVVAGPSVEELHTDHPASRVRGLNGDREGRGGLDPHGFNIRDRRLSIDAEPPGLRPGSGIARIVNSSNHAVIVPIVLEVCYRVGNGIIAHHVVVDRVVSVNRVALVPHVVLHDPELIPPNLISPRIQYFRPPEGWSRS